MKIYKPFSINGAANEIAGAYTDIQNENDINDMELANSNYVFELISRSDEKLVNGVKELTYVSFEGMQHISYVYRDPFHPTSYDHTVLILKEKNNDVVKIWCGEEAQFIIAAETANGIEFCIVGLTPQQLNIYPDKNSPTFAQRFLENSVMQHEFNHAMGLLDDCAINASSDKSRVTFSMPKMQSNVDYLVETIGMSELSKADLIRKQNDEFEARKSYGR